MAFGANPFGCSPFGAPAPSIPPYIPHGGSAHTSLKTVNKPINFGPTIARRQREEDALALCTFLQ